MSIECHKCGNDVYWYPATNEDGWKCCSCGDRPGEPPGFDPVRDRDDVIGKCWALTMELQRSGLVYYSNSGHGDSAAWYAAQRCVELGLYDQYTILRILIEQEQKRHADYWGKISNGVIDGNDSRDRCHCGAIARVYTNGVRYCFDHMPGLF